ncbi:MAG: protein-glutamate O-methyltransferase CheR, partial [Nitrospirota bacterium]|nr:protein-glutamate O-methyltransferase CheR [Nitrospirota bacterium]
MQLAVDTFKQLRDLIYERSGMFFQDNKKYILEGRLQARLRERHCRSYEDYYKLLKFDAWRDSELTALFDLITTNETFFFRDLPQLHAFNDTIVPAVMEANQGTSKLRIWSAACSTGDEPYTLAMMLLERPGL